MKYLLIFIFFVMSCSNSSTDINYSFYEKVSGLKMPSKLDVIENIDNGVEGIRISSLNIDNLTLLNYIKRYNFKPVANRNIVLWGIDYLKVVKPSSVNIKNEFFAWGDKGQDHWVYIADIKRNILWISIMYPDWADNN